MLAGVLLTLCLAPVKAVAVSPVAGLAVVLTWLVVGLWRKVLAVPAAVIVAAVIIAMTTPIPDTVTQGLVPTPLLIAPHFSFAALIGTALPLYIVTMAAQNIPGMAVLNANDYRPEFGPILRNTGAFTLLAAPFGGHAVNLAAITAALCAGPDADPNKDNRYWAAVVCGIAYIIVGLISGAATAFIAGGAPHSHRGGGRPCLARGVRRLDIDSALFAGHARSRRRHLPGHRLRRRLPRHPRRLLGTDRRHCRPSHQPLQGRLTDAGPPDGRIGFSECFIS